MGRLIWIIIPFRRISTLSKKQVLGNWKMNVIALTMAICALFVMNLEISFAGLKEREVSMMRTGEAPAYRSIEREEPAYRSIEREEPAYRNIEREDYTRTREDNPTSGGVEDRRRRLKWLKGKASKNMVNISWTIE